MDDNKTFVTTVAIIFGFLALLILSSCQGDMYKNTLMTRNYVACVEAQKDTIINLNCGNFKGVK